MSLITHFTFLYFNVICLFEAVKYVVVVCQVKIKTNLSLGILIFRIFFNKMWEQTGVIFLDGKVTGRGCSTKRSSYIKCETHSYGVKNEKFCYCSRTQCNRSTHLQSSPWLLLGAIFFSTSAFTSISEWILESHKKKRKKRRKAAS